MTIREALEKFEMLIKHYEACDICDMNCKCRDYCLLYEDAEQYCLIALSQARREEAGR
jgi:hypothetical protein